MHRKTKFVLGLLVAVALVVTQVPAVALADEEDECYGGWGWCHDGSYGAAALSDRATLNKVASVLGLTSAKLSASLRAGDTVAEIAAEKGVDMQKVVGAALARHKDLLQRRVEFGYITQSEADAILRLMEEQVETAFEEGFGFGYGYGVGPGMMGTSGHMGGMMGGLRLGSLGLVARPPGHRQVGSS